MVNPRDQWHGVAENAKNLLGDVLLVTTDIVLMELLTALSSYGPVLRDGTAKVVRSIISNPNIEIIPQTRALFLEGLDMYEKQLDKKCSLQDCISMVLMRKDSIKQVLTSDRHFEQEGFIVLM